METVRIRESQYSYINDYRHNKALRDSFNDLSESIFGLNFEKWYIDGYWKEQYTPYSVMDGDKIVANISANLIDFRVMGELKRYIQIGTVMTHSDYRNKGLSRFLMEKVLNDRKNKCDAIYLFANDSVLDFYPKFGFEEAEEYQYSKMIKKTNIEGTIRKLNMDSKDDVDLLLSCYEKSNPFSFW